MPERMKEKLQDPENYYTFDLFEEFLFTLLIDTAESMEFGKMLGLDNLDEETARQLFEKLQSIADGEQLPEDAVTGAVAAISKADMLIIGGTSLTVYPAASYIGCFRGKYLAIINKSPIYSHMGRENTVQINEPIGEVLKQVI